jgi:hypothetical protein
MMILAERGSADPGSSFSAVDKLPELSADERQEVKRQSQPNAALIHETIRAEGRASCSALPPPCFPPTWRLVCRWASLW